MRNAVKRLLALVMFMLLLAIPVAAADFAALEKELDVTPTESCQDAIDYYKEGDLKAAIESVDICKSEMEEIGQHLAAASFKDEIMGFKGGKLGQQSVLGMTQIERTYTQGDQKIEASLSSGKSASMMQMAISVSGRKTRVGKHNGFILNQNKENSIYVPVGNSAWIFKSKTADVKAIKKFAKAFMKGLES